MKIRFTLHFLLAALAIVALTGYRPSAAQGTPPPLKLDKKLKVALITPSAKNDLAWSQSMYDAWMKLKAEAGDNLEVTVSENLAQVPDAAAAIRDYASQEYDIIDAHGTQYGASMFEVAKDFPEITFIYGTASDFGASKGLKNVFAYEARAEQGGYVNGVMAATLSKAGVVGIVGPVNAGDGKLYIDGFLLGMKSTGKLKKDLPPIFTQSFGDTAKAAEAAKTLISQGADVLTGSAQQVPGAITEVQKAKGFWFGTQSNQANGWPDTVVAVQLYDWTGTLRDIVNNRLKGVKGGRAYEISLKDGGLKIVFNEKITLPAEVKAAGMKAIEDVIAGKVEGLAPKPPVAATPAATMAATMAATPKK
jgi:basic membrane protein A